MALHPSEQNHRPSDFPTRHCSFPLTQKLVLATSSKMTHQNSNLSFRYIMSLCFYKYLLFYKCALLQSDAKELLLEKHNSKSRPNGLKKTYLMTRCSPKQETNGLIIIENLRLKLFDFLTYLKHCNPFSKNRNVLLQVFPNRILGRFCRTRKQY